MPRKADTSLDEKIWLYMATEKATELKASLHFKVSNNVIRGAMRRKKDAYNPFAIEKKKKPEVIVLSKEMVEKDVVFNHYLHYIAKTSHKALQDGDVDKLKMVNIASVTIKNVISSVIEMRESGVIGFEDTTKNDSTNKEDLLKITTQFLEEKRNEREG